VHIRRDADDAEPLDVVAGPESDSTVESVFAGPQACGQLLVDQGDVGVRIFSFLPGKIPPRYERQVDGLKQSCRDADRLDIYLVRFIRSSVDDQPSIRPAIIARNTGGDGGCGSAGQ